MKLKLYNRMNLILYKNEIDQSVSQSVFLSCLSVIMSVCLSEIKSTME